MSYFCNFVTKSNKNKKWDEQNNTYVIDISKQTDKTNYLNKLDHFFALLSGKLDIYLDQTDFDIKGQLYEWSLLYVVGISYHFISSVPPHHVNSIAQ